MGWLAKHQNGAKAVSVLPDPAQAPTSLSSEAHKLLKPCKINGAGGMTAGIPEAPKDQLLPVNSELWAWFHRLL